MSAPDGLAPMCKLHHFHQFWTPSKSMLPVCATSVTGHLFSLDFDVSANRGAGAADPGALYGAKTEKLLEEGSKKNGLAEHLATAAAGFRWLFLWLDCDREGENICFEVISILRGSGHFLDDSSIYRAQFSALTPPALAQAFARPRRPNAFEAMAVDARQELDLKIGCSFTRYLTRQLLEGAKVTFNNSSISVISYGPCQTPTLGFCVQRYDEIAAFIPRAFWGVSLTASVGGRDGLKLQWAKPQHRTFVRAEAARAVASCQLAASMLAEGLAGGRGRGQQGSSRGRGRGRGRGAALSVVDVSQRERRLPSPTGLDTVQLLRAASRAMSMSPHSAMVVAERLYTSGFISYPRTESSRYPPSFDVATLLKDHATHPDWGAEARSVLAANPNIRPPCTGKDAGDHPPITPMRACSRAQLRGGQSDWRLYDYIVRNFIASMMPPFRYTEHTCTLQAGEDRFTYVWHAVLDRGWVAAMPWRLDDLHLNTDAAISAKVGDTAIISECQLTEGMTEPPLYLKEHELIELMDRHGIGTDASIPTHVQNICERQVGDERESLSPTVVCLPHRNTPVADLSRYLTQLCVSAAVYHRVRRRRNSCAG